jgi:5-methylcytosine-specific restriction endonuclease McrA
VPYKDPEVARQKQRERYLANQQSRIEYARRQRRERPEEISRQRRSRYQERKEETAEARLAYQRHWHEAHPEACRDYSRQLRARNPEAVREYMRTWKLEHPGAFSAYVRRRRTQVAAGMTRQEKAESMEWRSLIKDEPCFYCGSTDAARYEIDHYVSVASGGTDHWWNLVRACAPCNRRKATMNGDEFLAAA